MVLFADLPPAGPSPIEWGLMAMTLILTIAAFVFGIRVLRKINDEETDPEVKP